MRVLLVEDDPSTAKSIELMLSHANLNVYSTDLGEEGIDLAKLYDYDLILLDELNIALKYDYIDLDRVLDDLQARPEMQHVVVTGRSAPQELIDLADTVTEMAVVKHAFKDQGIKAQKGVEL